MTLDDTRLADAILEGDVRSASRLMRWIDDERPEARDELEALFPHTGGADVLGITGHPGSGKSTLVDALIEFCRDRDVTVGCIAVDPTSPFSGGAILGDRVRMNRHALDEGVFIRSVATRGQVGGLSRSTPACVQILDAMGFDLIVIETVGVGQDEVDIVRLADTNVVVMVPGLGDDVQATKAGILEIADVFAVNKSDLDGSSNVVRQLRTMIELVDASEVDWRPPIVETIATREEGIEALYDAVLDHREWLDTAESDVDRELRRMEHLVRLTLAGEFHSRLGDLLDSPEWQDHLDALAERRETPYETADQLLEAMFGGES
jgi:LAO/AO transport system kinase